MRAAVLGGGRVGHAIARDLAAEPEWQVTVGDRRDLSADFAETPVATATVDVGDPRALAAFVADVDIVVGAVPGALGFETLRSVIEAGRHVVDISFFAEDPFALDALATQHGVTAVVDCGVAPGLSNMVLGHAVASMDEVTQFVCYVGGLPIQREPPWEYKAPFSPSDVIEEYTRPARLRRNGNAVTLPALSDPELVNVPGLGTLEAFNTDGLRTLLHTTDVPDLCEKTLRYPGHRDKIEFLRACGLLDEAPVSVGDGQVRPIDLTCALLFEQWYLDATDGDVTAMIVSVEGRDDGKTIRRRYDMLDRWDRPDRLSSMARTTGYTCTGVTRLVADGTYRRAGISPPEHVARDPACYRAVLDHLRQRDIVLHVRDA